MDTEEFYIEKLNNGLYTLERVALIIAEICIHGPEGCLDRAMKMFRLKLKDSSLSKHLEPVCYYLKNFNYLKGF